MDPYGNRESPDTGQSIASGTAEENRGTRTMGGGGEGGVVLTASGAWRSGSRASPPRASGGGLLRLRLRSRRRRPSEPLAAAVACGGIGGADAVAFLQSRNEAVCGLA
jgi:hypothetical protein